MFPNLAFSATSRCDEKVQLNMRTRPCLESGTLFVSSEPRREQQRGLRYIKPCLADTEFSAGPESERTGGQRWGGVILELRKSVPPVHPKASFNFVQSRWTVPNVAFPDLPSIFARTKASEKAQGSTLACTVWVGFNGIGGPHEQAQLWQGGTQSNLDIATGATWFYTWFQVLGPHGTGKEFFLNLPVSAGDLIEVSIKKIGSVPPLGTESNLRVTFQGAAHFTYTNHTSRTFTEFKYFCQDPLFGRSVEWIVERPGQAPKLEWLPRFGSVYFSNASCRFNDGSGGSADEVVRPGALPPDLEGRNITSFRLQRDSAGKQLTAASTPSAGLVLCDYVGPSWRRT